MQVSHTDHVGGSFTLQATTVSQSYCTGLLCAASLRSVEGERFVVGLFRVCKLDCHLIDSQIRFCPIRTIIFPSFGSNVLKGRRMAHMVDSEILREARELTKAQAPHACAISSHVTHH
jgi:hypothetical protein